MTKIYALCNTMGISASDMNEITQTWSGELSNWRATASNDENAYEIEDDDFSKAYNSGKSTVQDKTGYDGGNPTSGDGAGTRGLGLGAGTGDNSGTDAGSGLGLGTNSEGKDDKDKDKKDSNT